MFPRVAVIGFSSLALVACSSGSATGVDAPASAAGGDAGGGGGSAAGCEANPYGECYPTADLGTTRADYLSSSGKRRNAGSTMRNYKWLGFKPGALDRESVTAATLTQVALASLYDPKGQLGFKVVHLVASSRWCGVCAEETKNYLVKNGETDRAKGIVVLQTLIDGTRQGVPAEVKDLDAWAVSTGVFLAEKDAAGQLLKTGSIAFSLVLDPANQNFGPFFDGAGVPWNGWLDARTMEIIDYSVGFDPTGDAKALKYVAANDPKVAP